MRRTILVLALFGCSDYDLTRDVDGDEVEDSDVDTNVEPGEQPDIEVEPASLDFGWRPVDCPSDPQTVTVRNVGDADLDVTAIDLVGTGNGSFSHDGGPSVLAPGAETTFEVTFDPLSYEAYDVDVRVSSNDPDEAVVDVATVGTGSEDAMMEEVFEQPSPSAVDVLWVIDNSGSMSEEVARLQDSFDVFINEFVKLGLDYQIGVTTTDMVDVAQSGRLQGATKIITPATADPVAAFLANTNLGSSGSADERGLDAAKAALTDPLISSENAGLVRGGADTVLAVVVLSDEDDASSMSASAFSAWLESYRGDPALTSLSAIVGRKGTSWTDMGGCNDFSTGTSASAGTKYVDAAAATGGMWGDICQLDFDLVIKYLSYNAAGLYQQFTLAETPSNLSQVKVEVDGVAVKYHGVTGWSWISADNAVKFNGDAIPGPEATIVITYPVPADCN